MRSRLDQLSLLLWLLAGSMPALCAQASPPSFAQGSLEELRAQAKAAKKGLVVDFSSDAVEPCRRMLQTTWGNAGLWRAIGDRAMVARIDPDQDASAKAMALTAYPTLVLFGADGVEVERIVGYIDATNLENRLAAGLRVLPTDYKERLTLAQGLAKKGDVDAALGHYLWLWQHGNEHNPGFGGVRLSFFLSDFVRFGKQHAPAWQALEKLRDDLARRAAGGDLQFAVISDLVALARTMQTPDVLVDLHDKTKNADWGTHSVARRVFREALVDVLLKKGRAADVVAAVGDPLEHIESSVAHLQDGSLPLPAEMRKEMVRRAVSGHAGLLQALFEVRDANAKPCADRLLEIEGGVATWLLILKAAKAGGDDVACQDLAVRALQELPENDHARVRTFLRRR